MAFPDAASCDNWRYVARACYVAMSPPNILEFAIVPVWDWQGGKCKGTGKLLTSEWFHGNSIVDVEGLTTAFYNDDLPLFHQRCLAHTGSVICRPVIHGDGCGIDEFKVDFWTLIEQKKSFFFNQIKSTDPYVWNSVGECKQDLYVTKSFFLCYPFN